jgi:predicted RecB family nuclease
VPTKIDREVLEGYLKCRFKGHLKLTGEHGRPSDYALLLGRSRELIQRAAADKLLSAEPGADILRDVTATLALLKQGAPVLLDATIEGDGFAVRLDALRRVSGSSRLGDFHYIPVLCHEADRPTRDQRALLELLGLILGAVQGREPESGVLFYGPECRQTKLKLRPQNKQVRRLLGQVRELGSENAPPRLRLNGHCQVCEFRDRCQEEATAKDDLSLLRGMAESEIAKWNRRGISTVTQLSCTFRPRKPRPNQTCQPHQHALQALAVRERKIYLLGTPELPTGTTRIYLDLEGDPGRGFVYLLGMLVEADGADERFAFWADTSVEEADLFRRFLAVVDRHPEAWIYTYGAYESEFLRRMIRLTGRLELTDQLLPRLVNVLSVIHAHVYFPTYSNGLKEVAGCLGFQWTEPDASGLQSIVWRRRWEETGATVWKETLITYNLEDCVALRAVTRCLDAIRPGQSASAELGSDRGHGLPPVEEATRRPTMHGWSDGIYGVPDFGFICDRAYFDYQRERVFIRTSPEVRKSRRRGRGHRVRRNRRVNRQIELTSQTCPACGAADLIRRPNGSLARLAFDLRFTRGGIRRLVTRYTTVWHHCTGCGERFLPADYLRLEEFCHGLKSWAMYEYVAHRLSLPNLANTLWECYGLPINSAQVHYMKQLLANYYEPAYNRLLQKILAGPLVHGDETDIKIRAVGKAYVWVFTNLEEVVYLYRPSREGDFLGEFFQGFGGVLVTDFYSAYDALPCAQQKCLIHLLRDFNKDLLANPWDEELKSVAATFGRLLRTIVTAVDRFGLTKRHLAKYHREVDAFFRSVARNTYHSEVTVSYQQRLLKYRDKLFTFLNHDGVPWNNNNAEHAIKAFAQYREGVDGLVTDTGLKQYLILLSIQQTCVYKGVSFLKFLLSRETDIDVFRQQQSRKRVQPNVEVYPEGSSSSRNSRKRLTPTDSVRQPGALGENQDRTAEPPPNR